MSLLHFSRSLTKGTYHTVRVFVGIFSALAILAIIAFIFLRVYGIPGPLLHEIMRRVNASGIPVSVEGISLTLHGWRAEQVCYYSDNPDDLEPLFQSRQVFFSARNSKRKGEDSNVWNLDVRAVGVALNPSIGWGVSIPQKSSARRIEQLDLSVAFLPDRILISEGTMDWLGMHFNVNGTLLKGKPSVVAAPEDPLQEAPAPVPTFITEQQFQTFADRLKMISLPNGATLDVDFSINAADLAASQLNLEVHAQDFDFRGIEFSRGEVLASYEHSAIQVERIGLFQGNQSVQVSGEYNLESKVVSGSLYNTITSNQLLLLLPSWIHALLSKAELRVDQLPRLDIAVGPAPVKGLLNHLSGTFSVHGVGYQGIEIESLRGRVKRENKRIEFTELQCTALGQEERAEETGSSMHGGFAEGLVFWDGITREFGVDVDASIDPNILVKALAPIEIATNIIQRFSFKDQPPRGHVRVGADLDDVSTFYIDIQALGNDVIIQGVEFTSVNITQTYLDGKLNLDPLAATQGSDFLKGSVRLNFHQSTVAFDLLSSMNPADLEDLAYAPADLFGNHINTVGKINLAGQGIFDWGSMQQTDFTVTVEAERFDLPVAQLNDFTATVTGEGPLITVSNASFGLYDGEGTGEFSIIWDPSIAVLPYETDFSFSGSDFRKFLAFFHGERPVNVSGTMAGNAYIEADFSTNFFAAATGECFIRVDKGQLADLPLFSGFSRLIRKIFPSFKVFTITKLSGNFLIEDGMASSEDALFEGNVIRAKGRGSYKPVEGFDALVQAQTLGKGKILSAVRIITDPLLKLFEMKLTGPLADPVWELEKF